MLQTFKTKLTNKKQLSGNVYLFRFDLIEPQEINFKAGQYIVLQVPKDNGFVPRLYSIASSTINKNYLELLIEIIPGGVASEYLNKLEIDNTVIFKGPAGMFILKEKSEDKKINLVFFATGTGIAPIRSILMSHNLSNFNKVILFWGMSHYLGAIFLDELKGLAQNNSNFQFKICLSREENLSVIPEEDKIYYLLGRVNKAYEECFPQSYSSNTNYYICGSREVSENLRQYLIEKEIAKENLHFEKY